MGMVFLGVDANMDRILREMDCAVMVGRQSLPSNDKQMSPLV